MSDLKVSLKDKQSNTLLPVTDASCVNDAEQGKSQAEINRMLLSNNSEVFYVRRVGDNLSHVSEVEAGTWLGGMGMSNGFAMCVFNTKGSSHSMVTTSMVTMFLSAIYMTAAPRCRVRMSARRASKAAHRRTRHTVVLLISWAWTERRN